MMKGPAHKTSKEEMAIWLVEDNERFRSSIRDLINETAELRCALAVRSCEEALERLDTETSPDVMLMDIGLPGLDGIEGIRKVKALAMP